MCKERCSIWVKNCKCKEDFGLEEIFRMNITYVIYGLGKKPASVTALGQGDHILHTENLRFTVLGRSLQVPLVCR